MSKNWKLENPPSPSHQQSTQYKANDAVEQESQNAFNNYNNLKYQYQYGDIRYIGDQLVKEYNKSYPAQQPVIFTDPLVQGRDLGNIEVNPSELLKQSKHYLDNNHKVVGIFNTGGNHWIAYVLFGFLHLALVQYSLYLHHVILVKRFPMC